MKRVLDVASSTFAAIPGLAVIATGLGVPPNQKLLFGGVMQAFGTATLLLMWLSGGRIKRISRSAATKWTAIGLIAFVAFLSCYIILLNNCVIVHPDRGTVYYPLWTAGTARGMIVSAGSRYGAIEKYGRAAVEDAVQENSTLLSATTCLLILIYQGIFSSATAVFGVLALAVQPKTNAGDGTSSRARAHTRADEDGA
jgi:hypothetical protein